MKGLKLQKHGISGVFVFLLLGIFAVASTVMVLIGAQAYQNSVDRSQAHNTRRIASSYLRSKLREADALDTIVPEPAGETASASAGSASAGDRLLIRYPEERTVTVLYVSDGMLYEWYTLEELANGAAEAPESIRGESICPLDEMRILQEDSLLRIRLRTGKAWDEVIYAPRSDTGGEE